MDDTFANLPAAVRRTIDQWCDRFEAEWKAGRVPDISEFLADISASAREILLNELLTLDISYRGRFGHPCTMQAHLEQFPNNEADVIAAWESVSSEAQEGEPGAQLHGIIADKAVGDIVGYTLREQIGEGGFGVVYAADQIEPVRRRVAVKIIKPGMSSREIIARFDVERQALAMMDHPNIAKAFDAGTTNTGLPYFAMELVRGKPVTEFCDEQRLTIDARLTLFVEVCRAVQHAHQKGIIHRDLKPSNVMVTMHDDRPVAKVIDFGVAKAIGLKLNVESVYTALDQLVGTPLYMSPEQAQLSTQDVDTRSDVYSLGVLLYELLTGSTPFDKQAVKKVGLDEVRRMIRDEEPPRPSARFSMLAPDVRMEIARHRKAESRKHQWSMRGELDWIALKCLEKDPSLRYETANGLARDVERYLSDEPIEARPPSVAYRFNKLVRRNKWGFAGAGLVAGCFAFVVAAALLYARQQHELAVERAQVASQRESARQQAEADRQETEAILYGTLIGRSTAVRTARTPGFRREVFDYLHQALALNVTHKDLNEIREEVLACLGDPLGLPPITAEDLGELAIKRSLASPIPDHFRALVAAHASGKWGRAAATASGEWLATYQADSSDDAGALNLWGRRAERIARATPNLEHVHSLVFTQDGSLLVAGCESGTLVLSVPRLEQVSSFRGHPVYSLAVHPNGRQLATLGQVFNVEVWSLVSNRMIRSMPVPQNVNQVEFSADGDHLLGITDDLDDKRVQVAWRLNSTPEKRYLVGHLGGVPNLEFTADGSLLATASKDHTVRLWHMPRGELIHTLKGHTKEVQAATFSPNGELVASGSWDGTIGLWDTKSGERLAVGENAGFVWQVRFAASGELLVSGSDHGIDCWNVERSPAGVSLTKAQSIALRSVMNISLRPNGLQVAAQVPDGIHIYNLPTGTECGLVDTKLSYYTLHVNSAGSELFFLTANDSIGMWDFYKNEIVVTSGYTVKRGPNCHAYSADDRWLATHYARRLNILEFDTGKNVLALPSEPQQPMNTVWGPEGRYLAAGLPGGDVVVWDLELVRARLGEFGIEVPPTSVNAILKSQ